MSSRTAAKSPDALILRYHEFLETVPQSRCDTGKGVDLERYLGLWRGRINRPVTFVAEPRPSRDKGEFTS